MKKKISIKQGIAGIRISGLTTLFFFKCLALIVLRCLQMAKHIDSETGFYTSGGAVTAIFFWLLVSEIITFCVISFLSADSKKIEITGRKDNLMAAGSIVFAVALLYDSADSFMSAMLSSAATANYTTFMTSGKIPLTIQSIFALLSAVYFFLLGKDMLKGTNKTSSKRILATAPVFWAGAGLILRFLRQISFVVISDLFLELAMLAFMVLFFMALAQVNSGIYTDSVRWRVTGFGLSAALIAGVISVSRLIFTFVAPEFINSSYPFSLSHLAFMVFAVTTAMKIKKDVVSEASQEITE